MQLHATSEGRDPGRFVPGEDLVLTAGHAHGTALAPGVVLDDHLSVDDRRRTDALAHAAFATWREQAASLVARDGISLADVWNSEIFAEVVLPAVRIRMALPPALDGVSPGRIGCAGIGPTRAGAVRTTLADTEWRVAGTDGETVDPLLAHFARPPFTLRQAPRRIVDALGLPSRVRGDVLVVAYGTTMPVLERLAAGGTLRPAFHGAIPPPAPLALRVARRGGLTGRPGAVARRRSRRWTLPMVDALERLPVRIDVDGVDLGSTINAGAARYLRARATETHAWTRMLRRALADGPVRAVLLPFDWDPVGGTLVAVARSLGIPTICLQHGYEPAKAYVPGGNSDARGAWSKWDLLALSPADRERTRVVGDTRRGADPGRSAVSAGARTGPAVVLVQLDSRVSVLQDTRVPARHAAAAVDGLRRVMPDVDIVLRPHPSTAPSRSAELGNLLGVPIDTTTPLRELLDGARVCIGAFSTGTLECALSGTPVVMLDLDRLEVTPPLGGTGEVPYATNADELEVELRRLVEGDSLRGHGELLEALGFGRPDPAGAVIAWLEETTRSGTATAARD